MLRNGFHFLLFAAVRADNKVESSPLVSWFAVATRGGPTAAAQAAAAEATAAGIRGRRWRDDPGPAAQRNSDRPDLPNLTRTTLQAGPSAPASFSGMQHSTYSGMGGMRGATAHGVDAQIGALDSALLPAVAAHSELSDGSGESFGTAPEARLSSTGDDSL
jgi:hypothetical protein